MNVMMGVPGTAQGEECAEESSLNRDPPPVENLELSTDAITTPHDLARSVTIPSPDGDLGRQERREFGREGIRRYLSNVSMRGEGVMNSMTKIIEGNKDKKLLKTIENMENKSSLGELNRMYQDSALVGVDNMDQGVREEECEDVSGSGKKYPLTRRIPEQQQTSHTEPTTARRVEVDTSCSEVQDAEL